MRSRRRGPWKPRRRRSRREVRYRGDGGQRPGDARPRDGVVERPGVVQAPGRGRDGDRVRGDGDRRPDGRWDNDRRDDRGRGGDRRDWDDRRGSDRRDWDRGDRRDWDRYDHRGGGHSRWERGRYPQVYVNPHRYRYSWRPPSGFYVRSWAFGEFLPRSWYGPDYWIVDAWRYDLPLPPPGYDWVRVGYDALLIDEYSGRIVQVVRNVFW